MLEKESLIRIYVRCVDYALDLTMLNLDGEVSRPGGVLQNVPSVVGWVCFVKHPPFRTHQPKMAG